MKNNFNLSEKEFGLNELPIYYKEDVKEFIRLLKEKVTKGCMGTSANCYLIKREIDKLAGDKLI